MMKDECTTCTGQVGKTNKKKKIRLLAAALSFCLLFTTYPNLPETLLVFAAGEQGEEDDSHISGFAELPEEISVQTVPVGTKLSELELPDSLEAYVVADKGENSSGGGIEEDADKEIPDDPKQNNNQDKDDEGDSSSTGEAGENGDGSSTGEAGENGDGSSTGEAGENGDSSSTGEESENGDGGENVTEQSGTEESDGGEEDTDIEDDQEQNTQPEESGTQEADMEETHAVAMQEYYAENVVTVETLENTQPSEVEEETITVEGVTWQSEPAYDGDIAGTYMFTAVLPEDYVVAEGVSLPKITMTVEEVNVEPRRAAARAVADGNLRNHTNHTGWTRLTNSTLSSSGNYYLDANVSSMTVKSGATVNLCLNGHDIASGYSVVNVQVENGATLNLYDCQGSGMIRSSPSRGKGIYASGTDAKVNLYGGTVTIEGCEVCAVYLEDGAQLLVDGAEVKSKVTSNPFSPIAAVYLAPGSSAEIRSGSVFTEITDSVRYNVNIIYADQNSRLTISGGTFEQTGGWYGAIATGMHPSKDDYIEINGGTINANVGMELGTLVVNNTDIRGHIFLRGGLLKLEDGKTIGSAEAGEPDILFSRSGSSYSMIEFANAPVTQDGYTIRLYAGAYSASRYPLTITKNFSTYMPGKQPTDFFTYLSSGDKEDHYRMILQDGEVVLLPYVMTFDANGGEELEDSEDRDHMITDGKGDITGGLYMSSLPIPTREGYTFDGWFTQADGGTEITIDNEPWEEDITVYAHWTLIDYPITYDLDGGALPAGKTNPNTYTIESAAFTLNNPVRTGYTFTGWSGTGLTGNTNKNVTVAKGSMGEREYTANWTADTYLVTLNGNGGSAGTTLTGYTYGTGATLPTNWTKPGYTFAGWYENSNLSGSAVTAISKTDTGNKNFYAKWTANQYTVTFDYQEATGGNGTQTKKVTYDGVYGELPTPSRTGYAFKGWYTQADGKGNQITSESTVGTADAHTLYAYWLDETAPDVPVLQDGTTLPTGWNNGQDTIPLKLYDGVAVTGLLVSVDGGAYTQVTQFPSGSTEYAYKVTEGEHTYRFKAVDAAGNESAQSAEYKIMLDTTKPVIETLSYENKAKNFLDWIIGKKSLIIHVPVKEDGSGVTEINYTMTPIDESGDLDDDSTVAKTAPVKNGEAKITFAGEFRGRVVITCADKAGNAADSVTVDTKAGANGVIVEDRAPEISMLADRNISDMTGTQPGGVELSGNYYESVPAVIVTVKDDTDNAISAGIDQITYQVDGAEKTVSARHDMLQSEITFTIPADEIPTGVTVIRVNVTDNAGNEASKSVTVRIKGPEKTPAAAINYQTEKLKDLVPKAEYLINGTSCTADGAGCIAINKGWLGTTVSIVKKGNGNETSDSGIQNLIIPQRPQKPSPVGADVSTPGGKGKLTGLTANTSYEVSADGGRTWESSSTNGSGELTGLAPGSYIVHVKAGTSNFASENSDPAKIGAYQITIIFMANGEKYKEISMDYGTALKAIPSVPKKEDGGNQTYVGEWCDAQGNPVDFTSITANMTVYAAYTAGYTVTLQGGTGCTLSAVSGSKSPVKEGSSFTFKFTLGQGYEKTSGFAVKVNGESVKLTAGETYTITDIRENKTVTVEGVRRKPSSGGSTSSGSTGSSGGSDKETGGSPSAENSSPSDADPSTNSNQQAGGSSTTGDTSAGSTPPSGTDSETPVGGNPFGGTDSRTPVGGNPFGGTDDKTPPDGKPADRTEGVADETPPDGNPSVGKDTIVTVPVSIENGRIIISGGVPGAALGKTMEEQSEGASEILYGEHIATGNVDGMTAISTILQMSDGNANSTGAVIVTVVCEEQACTAGVADAVAVANAVLTAEQIQLVNDGETTEIRIDVTDISESVPTQDKKVIEDGVEAYRKELPELTLGMYIDISMYIKVGDGEWDAITATRESIEVVIGIPEELQSEGRKYCIIRAHDGEYAVMQDKDDTPDTITISTDRFSSYAIAYQQTDGAGAGNAEKCGLCHICPTFLGICYFIWLVIAVAVIIIVIILLRRRTQEEK